MRRIVNHRMVIIRPESEEDYEVVRRINELAFGRPSEAALVDALRTAAPSCLSLVAEREGHIIGHIFFSPVEIEPDTPSLSVMGLGPMAVLPEYQSQGIGSQLVERGLEECKRLNYDVVVVIGHPKFYPRFGFRQAGQRGLDCEYDVPDEVFMVAELRPGALAGRQGLVKYHPEFSRV